MAERKNTTAKTVATENKAQTTKSTEVETTLTEDFNLDAKVTVRNLAGWDVTFTRLHDGAGDVIIVANGQTRLSRNEINAQIDNNNKLFTGSDGQGSHATIIIDDADTRKWVGFEDEDRPQKVFTEQVVIDLFKMSQDKYETALCEIIQTRAEKYALMEAIKKLKLNDYGKIVFASQYTGYRL